MEKKAPQITLPDLSSLTWKELEDLLVGIQKQTRPIINEMSKRFQEIKKQENLKKAS